MCGEKFLVVMDYLEAKIRSYFDGDCTSRYGLFVVANVAYNPLFYKHKIGKIL